jgi:phosphoglycerate dehydrogenase-like enzyme
MPETLHVWLASDVAAFDFQPADFAPLRSRLPATRLVHHRSRDAFVAALPAAELVTTWVFEPEWYAQAPRLRAVMTPAAGRDWVAVDPSGRVPTRFGSFHGPMIAESLLGMMLHFNRRIPAMLENERRRAWDRNLQFPGRLLANQRVLLIGYGHIGRACARLLHAVGLEVVGCRRNPIGRTDPETGARLVRPDALPAELALADHVVLLLPGGASTAGFLDRERLGAMKRSARVYNFGRGTALCEDDLLWALDAGRIAGAGLDVTEREPLPADSRLWEHPEVFVQPHSSCVYDEYRALHVAELAGWLHEL